MKKETLEFLDKSRKFSVRDKYLYVYEWLKSTNCRPNAEYFNSEIITDSIQFSLATNLSSDKTIDSMSNFHSNSFDINFTFEKKSPNIFLPKFIFNNRPLKTQDSTRIGLNDNLVSDLLNEFRKKRSKSCISKHSNLQTDPKSNNLCKEAYLKVENLDQKLILREKLKKAKIKNDLLKARIKLDLFVL